MSDTPITNGLLEAKDYLEELLRASSQNFEDVLVRYAAVLADDQPVGNAVDDLLAEADFDQWYEAASGTQGGMVGSARLTWPSGREERVALQLELIRRFGRGDLNPVSFAGTFTYEGRRISHNLQALAERVLVPFHRDLLRVLEPAVQAENAEDEAESPETRSLPYNFIDPTRLSELRALQSGDFDLRRLIQYCEEIDFCFRNGCFLAVAALTRALMDHVPPIFGMSTFVEVANNYGGSRSFKASMQHLEQSARKIGDAHLHEQIRATEVLPTATQVDFHNNLDVLLGEIVRCLRGADVA